MAAVKSATEIRQFDVEISDDKLARDRRDPRHLAVIG